MTQYGKKRPAVITGAAIPAPSLSRFFCGLGSLSPVHMQAIVRFTGGTVTYDDLIAEAAANKAKFADRNAEAVRRAQRKRKRARALLKAAAEART